jgi:hypothetical protein
MKQVQGSNLTLRLQRAALDSFHNRYTSEHVPMWALRSAPNGRFYAPQFSSDTEWLSCTTFTLTGKTLTEFSAVCDCRNESWPLGKWLDAPFIKIKQSH